MAGSTDGLRRSARTRNQSDPLVAELCSRVIGQSQAMHIIAPYVRIYGAGLSPEGRPAGVFLLLGPTGTGKTRTVEALADVLHGTHKSMLRIDCGEYQMDHEVAKLIGAPPGYLGHRETQPVLTQARLAAITSARSSLSIVLFDEVEKAAPSLTRLLLGVLDKASLRLGDNNMVNFERSLIFLTSNVGARGIQASLGPGVGFGSPGAKNEEHAGARLEQIALRAARQSFPPEFLNRVDAIVTYNPLSRASLEKIVDLQLAELQDHIVQRLGPRAFTLELTRRSRLHLLEQGTSAEYGAREIRRVVHRLVTQPLANLVASHRIRPGACVKADLPVNDDGFTIRAA